MPQPITLISLLRRGAALGAVTGLTVSLGYTLLLITIFLVSALYGALTTAPSRPEDSAVMLLVGPAMAGFMFICAGFIGILPGILLGAVIGLVISLPLGLARSHLNSTGATIVGVTIAALVVGLIHLFLLKADPDPTLREYLLLTILPGGLCIIAGGWVGRKLHQAVRGNCND